MVRNTAQTGSLLEWILLSALELSDVYSGMRTVQGCPDKEDIRVYAHTTTWQ